MNNNSSLLEIKSFSSQPSTMLKRYSFQIPPEPPKKALCPFFLYRMDIYELVKREHPNLRITEITKIIAQMWKTVDPQLKQRYEQQYQLNRSIVVKQRQKYQSQYGRQVRSRKSRRVRRDMAFIKRRFYQDF